VKGKKILDAGCGEGYLSRILAQRGASVIAVDYSKKMIEMAKEKTSDKLSIVYHHGNCEELDFLEKASFDIIVSNMVLQDFAGYKKAIKQMYELLKENGIFIFSISHPCFSTPSCGWIRNEKGEKSHWKTDRYFDEVVFEQPWPRGIKDGVLQFHRTLTSYFNTVIEAGFVVESLVEPKPSEEMIRKYPGFKDDLRMCHFLVFKARKL
jgi:2-polyprenyl-3-methyl-5-hydroxy-6-metoxy-1,4-benzoquinol methylase